MKKVALNVISHNYCNYKDFSFSKRKKFLSSLADMYIKVFGVEPWNEGYVCEKCGKLFSLEEINLNCCWKIRLYYDSNELIKGFLSWFKKDSFVGIILEDTEKKIGDVLNLFVGFCIWWGTSINKLNDEKLKLLDSDLSLLVNNIRKLYPDFDLSNFFYLADMWLIKEYKWKGLASKLFKRREEEILKNWYRYVLVRTTRKSDVPFKWYKDKLWFKLVFKYNDQQDRVILVKKLSTNEKSS